MSEKRTGPPTESRRVLRVTADALLDEALGGFEDPSYRRSENYPPKTYLHSVKRIGTPADPDQYERDEQATFRDAIDGISVVGRETFGMLSYVKDIRNTGMRGPIDGVHLHLDLRKLELREAILAPPLFGARPWESPERAAEADRILDKARDLSALIMEYRIERRAADAEAALDRFRAVLKAGVRVSELTIVRDTPEARRQDRFPHLPPPERTGRRVSTLLRSHPELMGIRPVVQYPDQPFVRNAG
jgi:hypothetical protein